MKVEGGRGGEGRPKKYLMFLHSCQVGYQVGISQKLLNETFFCKIHWSPFPWLNKTLLIWNLPKSPKPMILTKFTKIYIYHTKFYWYLTEISETYRNFVKLTWPKLTKIIQNFHQNDQIYILFLLKIVLLILILFVF